MQLICLERKSDVGRLIRSKASSNHRHVQLWSLRYVHNLPSQVSILYGPDCATPFLIHQDSNNKGVLSWRWRLRFLERLPPHLLVQYGEHVSCLYAGCHAYRRYNILRVSGLEGRVGVVTQFPGLGSMVPLLCRRMITSKSLGTKTAGAWKHWYAFYHWNSYVWNLTFRTGHFHLVCRLVKYDVALIRDEMLSIGYYKQHMLV